MWRQYLQEMNATETRVFVIAERTEELAPEVLRALDALTGTDASGSPGANVVLLGHQGLDGFLGSPLAGIAASADSTPATAGAILVCGAHRLSASSCHPGRWRLRSAVCARCRCSGLPFDGRGRPACEHAVRGRADRGGRCEGTRTDARDHHPGRRRHARRRGNPAPAAPQHRHRRPARPQRRAPSRLRPWPSTSRRPKPPPSWQLLKPPPPRRESMNRPWPRRHP